MSEDQTIQNEQSTPVKEKTESKAKKQDLVAVILAAASILLVFSPPFGALGGQISFLFYLSASITLIGLLLAVFCFIWGIILTIKSRSVLSILTIIFSLIPIGVMTIGVVLLIVVAYFIQSWSW